MARSAAEFDFHVVEDLTPDTSLGLDVPPPIAAFDQGERVITLGSLSKIAWGGLRIGWIRAPRADVDRLVAGKIVADHATSLITQAIAARVLERVDEVVAFTREAAGMRRTIITEALAARLRTGSGSGRKVACRSGFGCPTPMRSSSAGSRPGMV